MRVKTNAPSCRRTIEVHVNSQSQKAEDTLGMMLKHSKHLDGCSMSIQSMTCYTMPYYVFRKSLSNLGIAFRPNLTQTLADGTSNLGNTALGLLTSLPSNILHSSLSKCSNSRSFFGTPN